MKEKDGPKEVEVNKIKKSPDVEQSALRRTCKILDALTPSESARVISWIYDKYVVEPRSNRNTRERAVYDDMETPLRSVTGR